MIKKKKNVNLRVKLICRLNCVFYTEKLPYAGKSAYALHFKLHESAINVLAHS